MLQGILVGARLTWISSIPFKPKGWATWR